MNTFHDKCAARAMDNLELLDDYENDFINKIAGYPEEQKLTKPQAHLLNRIIRKIDFGY